MLRSALTFSPSTDSTTHSPAYGVIRITLSLQRLQSFLVRAILLVHLANAARLFIGWKTGHRGLMGLGPLFDVDGEGNVPALFSALMLGGAGILAYVVASRRRLDLLPDWKYWYGIALAFFFLSVDEAVQLHEMLVPLGKLVANDGVFLGAWVIPAGLLVAIFGVLYAGMIFRLPPWLRNRGILAAALFLSGAIGMEMVGGPVIQANGRHLQFELCCAVEELLEMSGVAIWICALARYLGLSEQANGR
jgi:hypothetical protein